MIRTQVDRHQLRYVIFFLLHWFRYGFILFSIIYGYGLPSMHVHWPDHCVFDNKAFRETISACIQIILNAIHIVHVLAVYIYVDISYNMLNL